MNAFYIGQRVRLVKTINPAMYGLEGVICGFSFAILPNVPFPCNVCVIWNGAFDWRYDNTDRLEPILPSGLESPEEITALYEPSSRLMPAYVRIDYD